MNVWGRFWREFLTDQPVVAGAIAVAFTWSNGLAWAVLGFVLLGVGLSIHDALRARYVS